MAVRDVMRVARTTFKLMMCICPCDQYLFKEGMNEYTHYIDARFILVSSIETFKCLCEKTIEILVRDNYVILV